MKTLIKAVWPHTANIYIKVILSIVFIILLGVSICTYIYVNKNATTVVDSKPVLENTLSNEEFNKLMEL